jgi:OPT oligopeptide transporter protein
MYFIPVARALPLFGQRAARRWLWTLDCSPGFFGGGIITGPVIPLHMLAGAVAGWAVLSPLAHERGWAPGKVNDWESGSRGWIIWISLAALLADALVKLAWFFLRSFCGDIFRLRFLASWWRRQRRSKPVSGGGPRWSRDYDHLYSTVSATSAEEPAASHGDGDGDVDSSVEDSNLGDINSRTRGPSALTETSRVMSLGFAISVIACTIAVQYIFGRVIPWYYSLLAITLSLPMAVVGIRSLAETDYNPESGLGTSYSPSQAIHGRTCLSSSS